MGESVQLIEGRNWAPANLGDVAVLGLGVSGKAATRYLCGLLGSRVNSLTVYAGPSNDSARTFAEEAELAGARVLFDTEDVQGPYDLVVASPGISQFCAFYQAAVAQSAEVVSEVELAWRECEQGRRWIAITGTNGKTTTTACTAHLLAKCGWNAAAVGNIGDTCIEAVADGAADVLVAEVSSYQLASTKRFAPNCAVLLNITPDHLAWHRSFEAYVDAKGMLFSNLSREAGSYAVIDAVNDQARAFVRQIKDQGELSYVPVGTSAGLEGDMRQACGSANAAFVRGDGMLVVALGGTEYELVSTGDLLIEGLHNAGNALVAAAAALCLGAPVEGVRDGLRTFAPLEHRLEPCGSVNGVACYNDSKATNVDATLVALRSFASKRPIVLLGGDDKGTALDQLAATVAQSCKAAVCFGAAGPRFAQALSATSLQPVHASNMEQALDAALSLAQPGDTVLLSPACASFDEFDNFEQRGRVFKQLVKRRQE